MEFYKIRIKGNLDKKWSDWFDGFTITHQGHETLLAGPVPDQGALHGLLAKIWDLGLSILLVECLLEEKGQNETGGSQVRGRPAREDE